MKKGSFNHNPTALFRARELRGEMSVSERVVWERLRREQTGFSFRRQVRVDRFYLDFYCAKAKLCVEVDGEQHANQPGYDSRRDAILRSLGIETLRIPSVSLFEEDRRKFEEWIGRVALRCQERCEMFALPPAERAESPTPNPLPQRQTTLRDGAPDAHD